MCFRFGLSNRFDSEFPPALYAKVSIFLYFYGICICVYCCIVISLNKVISLLTRSFATAEESRDALC